MKWILIFFSINAFCCLYSQDTTRIISLPEIEVIEKKTTSNSALDFSPIITINNEQIQTIGAKQLSEVLIFSPGVNIQNQGGLGGMKTLFMRGMSSARNLILLDGIPLNSAQNGSFDLNNIDVSMIDNIEIIRGGASSIFGGSAIGGVVNIRKTDIPKEIIKINLSYGGYETGNSTGNEVVTNFTLNFPIAILLDNIFKDLIVVDYDKIDYKYGYVSFNINYIDSDGNYPFTFSQFGEGKRYYRENSDYNNLNASLTGRVNINGWTLTSRYIYSQTDKGIPGPILQGQVNNSNERLKEENHILFMNTNRSFNNNSILKISGGYKHNNLLYIGSNYDKNNSNFILNDWTINCIYNFNFLEIKNEALLTFTSSELTGDMLDIALDNKVNRIILAAGYRLEKDFLIDKNMLRFNLSGRFDKGFSKEETTNKSALTGNFGAIFKLKDIPLLLRTNISHNFRFPNFNEMYYRNYGTKNLLPEKSNNINIGAEYNILNKINISLDAFYLDIKDMIVAIPTSPVTWSARNISRAESIGTEFSAILIDNIKINKSISINNISVSYTLQQNLDKSTNTNTYNKQLTYIPNELGSAMISFKVFDFLIGGKLEYSSHRYYQADNSINSLLPSYTIADFFINAPIIEIYKNSINLRFDIKNIFDTQYFIINNYIMPGRQFRLSLGVIY
ncbi:MAG: TonB-dependent receptor [Bacteroidetes bacterium]|nr:TonB-dependent receptor [Bacteroidota bacterium]